MPQTVSLRSAAFLVFRISRPEARDRVGAKNPTEAGKCLASVGALIRFFKELLRLLSERNTKSDKNRCLVGVTGAGQNIQHIKSHNLDLRNFKRFHIFSPFGRFFGSFFPRIEGGRTLWIRRKHATHILALILSEKRGKNKPPAQKNSAAAQNFRWIARVRSRVPRRKVCDLTFDGKLDIL